MSLFPKVDQKKFMLYSYRRYRDMRLRVHKKGLGPLPFGVMHLRDHILQCTDGKTDAAIKCRYCNYYVNIWEAEFDHAVPLSRGGSTGLDNVEIICGRCNDEKGGMTPAEFIDFRITAEQRWPLAITDIFGRLRIATKLAAGQAYRNKKAKAKNGTNHESDRISSA